MAVPNFRSLARLEVPEKFVWRVGLGAVVSKVISVSNPTTAEAEVVLCYVWLGL